MRISDWSSDVCSSDLGRPGFGEVKIGRDIGLFASEQILNDITLLSSGTPAGNVAPSNTTLGRIGVGYIYTDFQPQITYTTPRSEEHTSELQSLMRISYAVFCLKKKKQTDITYKYK